MAPSIALIARPIALLVATYVAASALLGLAIDAATRCALTLHALMRVERHYAAASTLSGLARHAAHSHAACCATAPLSVGASRLRIASGARMAPGAARALGLALGRGRTIGGRALQPKLQLLRLPLLKGRQAQLRVLINDASEAGAQRPY